MKSCASCNQRKHMGTARLTKSGNDADVTQKTDKPLHYKSQILFESDTFFCNNILLDLAKYIH